MNHSLLLFHLRHLDLIPHRDSELVFGNANAMNLRRLAEEKRQAKFLKGSIGADGSIW
jgi:hypothetical protein